MAVSAQLIKELRERTNAPMMDCKKALTETDGDMDKAIDFLRKKGLAGAKKREGRIASEGAVGSYIHSGGRIGVMVEVNCETDFVARNEGFQTFVREIGMQIAASDPLYVRREDVPAAELEKPPAKVWEYAGGTCMFNLFFYPSVDDKVFRVLAYEVTDTAPPAEASSAGAGGATPNRLLDRDNPRVHRCFAELLHSQQDSNAG